jgi:hypothetical protein
MDWSGALALMGAGVAGAVAIAMLLDAQRTGAAVLVCLVMVGVYVAVDVWA